MGRQVSSRSESAARATFGRAKKGAKPAGNATPGPGEHAGQSGASQSQPVTRARAPAHAFGGPLCKRDRFGESEIAARNPRSPGPGLYNVPSTLLASTAPGSPTLGTARRFMNDPKLTVGAVSGGGGVCDPGSSQRSFYETEHARPGPGTYQDKSALGKQALSPNRSAETFKFCTSQRGPTADNTTPGPGQYSARAFLGTQVSTKTRTSPQFKFGTARRGSLMNPVG